MSRRTLLGRLVMVSLAAALSLAVTACNRDEVGGDQPTIGLAVANLQADFFNQIKQSVQAEAQKQGVKVIVSDAKGDAATQVNQIQDFITRQVDAIIYIPAGATAASVPVKYARQFKTPVVAVDRNPPDEPADTFIATDSVAAARTLGEYVVKATKGSGNVAILQGQIGTTPEIDRNKGFSEALSQAPGLKVVAEQPAEWAQDKAFDVATDMLQANRDIDVFFGRADAMALGAAQAVRGAGINPRPLIVGFDGDFAGLAGVRDGTIDATMVQQTQKMGRMAVDSALKLINGEQVPPEQLQEAFLVTKENKTKAAEYIQTHP